MHKNYIAGEWVAGESTIENRNPSDVSDIIGTYAQASAAQLDTALGAGRAAQKIWARTGLEARQAILIPFTFRSAVAPCKCGRGASLGTRGRKSPSA